MADVRERDIEAVARWLYEARRRHLDGIPEAWPKVLDSLKDVWRAVALALLEEPPLALRRRARELEGK